jgi:hypothetical protein
MTTLMTSPIVYLGSWQVCTTPIHLEKATFIFMLFRVMSRYMSWTMKKLCLCSSHHLPRFSVYKKGKAISLQALTGPDGSRSLRLQILKQSAHKGGKVVSPTQRPPLPAFRPEGSCQWKILMTPSGIDPATFRFVEQCLNNCSIACLLPYVQYYKMSFPDIQRVAVTRYLRFWQRSHRKSRYCRTSGDFSWWDVTNVFEMVEVEDEGRVISLKFFICLLVDKK